MKKIRIMLLTLCFVFTAGLSVHAAPGDIAYADFKKIEDEYTYAKNAYKQIDNKVLELQQFVIDKDKQYKSIDSPINKKNFEDRTQQEYKVKEEELIKFKMTKEEEIYNNIMNATKAVAAQKSIPLVLDYRVVFTGGIDISDDIIRYLNSAKK